MRAFFLIVTVIGVLAGLIPAQRLAAAPACDSTQLSRAYCETPQSLPQRVAQLADPCAAAPALLPQAQSLPPAPPPARLVRQLIPGTAENGQPPDLPWKPPRVVA